MPSRTCCLGDRLERRPNFVRRVLAVSVIFAGLVSLKLETPTLLLATTFLLGVGGPLTSPAWAAMTPLLVEAA